MEKSDRMGLPVPHCVSGEGDLSTAIALWRSVA
jgi:hypothetical protein